MHRLPSVPVCCNGRSRPKPPLSYDGIPCARAPSHGDLIQIHPLPRTTKLVIQSSTSGSYPRRLSSGEQLRIRSTRAHGARFSSRRAGEPHWLVFLKDQRRIESVQCWRIMRERLWSWRVCCSRMYLPLTSLMCSSPCVTLGYLTSLLPSYRSIMGGSTTISQRCLVPGSSQCKVQINDARV